MPILYSFDTATNLAANAILTGASFDGGTEPSLWPTRVRPAVRHLTSAGTAHANLVLQESSDGSSWFETKNAPIPADGQVRTYDWPTHFRYHRYVLRNGAQAQTAMRLVQTALRDEGSSIDVHESNNFLLSTTPLAAGASFASATFDLGPNSPRVNVRAAARSDQASTNGGITLQWSNDGTNWYFDAAAVATHPGNNSLYSVEGRATARFVRAFYVNGTTAQTAFAYFLTVISL